MDELDLTDSSEGAPRFTKLKPGTNYLSQAIDAHDSPSSSPSPPPRDTHGLETRQAERSSSVIIDEPSSVPSLPVRRSRPKRVRSAAPIMRPAPAPRVPSPAPRLRDDSSVPSSATAADDSEGGEDEEHTSGAATGGSAGATLTAIGAMPSTPPPSTIAIAATSDEVNPAPEPAKPQMSSWFAKISSEISGLPASDSEDEAIMSARQPRKVVAVSGGLFGSDEAMDGVDDEDD